MNYITEILCFQNFNRNHALSAGQISLWHALFAASNRQGLGQAFSVSDKMLQADSGLGESGMKKAREALCRKGLLRYMKPSGKRGERGVYVLASMEQKMSRPAPADRSQCSEFFLPNQKSVDKQMDKSDPKEEGGGVGKQDAYLFINKTKQTKQEKKKRAYGPFHNVHLTEWEYERLKKKFPDADLRIRRMSLYLEGSGKKYKNCYAALLQWAEKEQHTDLSRQDRQLLQAIADKQLHAFRSKET